MTDNILTRHRAHDYPHLIERWRAVAARTGMVMRRIAKGPEFPLYCLRSKSLPREGVIYISAGIHGDEPGATEGFITWAEKNTRRLRRGPFLLVPCINPWGLVNNIRTDSSRRDLNRSFQSDSIPEIVGLKRVMGRRRFSLGLTLHEDYDAQGIYIYEIPGTDPAWGEVMLEAARPHVPPDPRDLIEGRESIGGVVRRPLDMKVFDEIGMPEAVYLYLLHCPRVFTTETPSEYGLDRRVNAHVAVIEECVRRVDGNTKRRNH